MTNAPGNVEFSAVQHWQLRWVNLVIAETRCIQECLHLWVKVSWTDTGRLFYAPWWSHHTVRQSSASSSSSSSTNFIATQVLKQNFRHSSALLTFYLRSKQLFLWNRRTVSFFFLFNNYNLERRIFQVFNDHRESAFLFQRLSVLIQRFTAVAIQALSPTHPLRMRFSRSSFV